MYEVCPQKVLPSKKYVQLVYNDIINNSTNS